MILCVGASLKASHVFSHERFGFYLNPLPLAIEAQPATRAASVDVPTPYMRHLRGCATAEQRLQVSDFAGHWVVQGCGVAGCGVSNYYFQTPRPYQL